MILPFRNAVWATALALMLGAGPHAFASEALLHHPAPLFVRTDLQHRSIDLKAYRGKVVLLTFWATWCAPCQTEIPTFVQWQKTLGGTGFQVVAVSMDDGPEAVTQLMRRRRVNYPVIMGDPKLAEIYGGILGLPVNFLIDRRGMVRAVYQGESNLNAVRNQITALLREPAP